VPVPGSTMVHIKDGLSDPVDSSYNMGNTVNGLLTAWIYAGEIMDDDTAIYTSKTHTTI